jgi:phytoene dehydrogenase-like protein
MSLRHFDCVVIGRSLGCLSAAALLARRDFRVLVLGQGELPPSYSWQGRALARRTFSLLFGETPVWRRTLQDLAQSQTFRRRTRRVEPSFSLLMPQARVQCWSDRAALAAETRREFPELQPVIDEIGLGVGLAHRGLEAILERDSAWPPESLIERLQARRWLRGLPWVGEELRVLLDKLPAGHPYREAAFLPAAFAGDWANPPAELPVLSASRLLQAFVRHSLSFEGGEGAFEDFLVQRIQAHGGVCRLGERADTLTLRRGRVSGVVIGGGEQTIGTDCVVTGLEGKALLELAGGRGSGGPFTRWPQLEATTGRFVVSCWVRARGVPEPLAYEAILLPSGDSAERSSRPALHVQRAGTGVSQSGEPATLLVAEALVPLGLGQRVAELRDCVLEVLREHLPFVDRHLLLVDSPHDGLPLHVYEAGQRCEVERVHVPGASRQAEPLRPLWRAEAPGFLGLAGEPIAGPVRGSWLVGTTVFPGLGQEGELLAAWNVAQRVTRSDRAWQKRRRQMWSKIDTDTA